MIDGMGSLFYDLVRTLSPFRYLLLPVGEGPGGLLPLGAKSKISVVL